MFKTMGEYDYIIVGGKLKQDFKGKFRTDPTSQVVRPAAHWPLVLRKACRTNDYSYSMPEGET